MQLDHSIKARTQFDDPGSNLAISYIDPLDPDSDEDMPLVVTRRQLIRLAVVSTEVGARFQREAVDHDSMAWMLAPRKLFEGRDAIEASLEQRHCIRAIVLHGLGLGLDACPSDIDDLMNEREPDSRSRHGRPMARKRAAQCSAASDRRFTSVG